MFDDIRVLRRVPGAGSAESVDHRALAAGALGAVLLLVAFVSFVTRMGYETYAFAGVVAVVVYGWFAHQEETAQAVSFVMTVSTVVILGLITAFLFLESLPAFRLMGVQILLGFPETGLRLFGVTLVPPLDGSQFWRPTQNIYSLFPAIWGTVVTTAIAILISAPLGVACALFISEIAPDWAREIVKPGVEMLAGIPSIVYGFIGFTVLNVYLFEHFQLSGMGSLFLAGVLIGVMALPTVVSVSEDALDSVPESMKSGSLAVGTTEWQTMTSITLPAAFSGVSAAVLLGVGRAIGETMAATVVLGTVMEVPDPLYNIFGNTITLTSAIASQYGDASEMQMSALFAAGVVLFVTVLVLSVVSQYIEARVERQLGGQQ